MNNVDKSIINQAWPKDGLEQVHFCPFCHSAERRIAFDEIQDWSFYSAPGKWTYWECQTCQALYLNPRPTQTSLPLAYRSYYTHTPSPLRQGRLQQLEERIRNECWSHWLNLDILPRLHLPPPLSWLLHPLHAILAPNFELQTVLALPPGKLLDIGCGSGNLLHLASQKGWQTTGIEIDPAAIKAARARSLNIVEGGHEKLAELDQDYDCIVCCHVLEHTPNPRNLLTAIRDHLHADGTFILSLPNANSLMRYRYGKNWRGLEAPRHLALPAAESLRHILENMGFVLTQHVSSICYSSLESVRIRRRATSPSQADRIAAFGSMYLSKPSADEQDFIQFVCRKRSTPLSQGNP